MVENVQYNVCAQNKTLTLRKLAWAGKKKCCTKIYNVHISVGCRVTCHNYNKLIHKTILIDSVNCNKVMSDMKLGRVRGEIDLSTCQAFPVMHNIIILIQSVLVTGLFLLLLEVTILRNF